MTESDDYWTEIDGGSEFHSRQTVVATNEAGLVPETMPGANALARLTAILFSDPTWQTYALIDPSLVFGLSVELGKSDEFHRCLHRNPDHGNAGEAYPWLVRLQPESPVFHKLCTSGQPRGWWEDEVGIFIRTTLPPDRLWSHLRKFHRVRDENGDWFLLRYWDPELLLGLTRIELPALTGLILPQVEMLPRWGDQITKLSTQITPPSIPIQLQPGDKARIGSIRTHRRVRAIGAQLRSEFGPELEDTSDLELWRKIPEILDTADDIGLTDGATRAKFVIMSVVTVPDMHLDKTICRFLRHSSQPDQRFRELDDVIRRRVTHALKESNP